MDGYGGTDKTQKKIDVSINGHEETSRGVSDIDRRFQLKEFVCNIIQANKFLLDRSHVAHHRLD